MKLRNIKKAALSSPILTAILVAPVAADAQTLSGIMVSAKSTLSTAGTTINILAGITGAYFILSGIMAWRKSSGDHGGQVEFKSVVVPIVAGGLLVAFSSFVAATSSEFGFSTGYNAGGLTTN